jgi:hypothetical protein
VLGDWSKNACKSIIHNALSTLRMSPNVGAIDDSIVECVLVSDPSKAGAVFHVTCAIWRNVLVTDLEFVIGGLRHDARSQPKMPTHKLKIRNKLYLQELTCFF